MEGLSLDELRAAVGGGHPRFRTIAIPALDLPGLEAALGSALSPEVAAGSTLDADGVRAAVRGQEGILGFLRASDVTPDLRALAVDGRTLFGNGRDHDLGGWPLLVDGGDVTAAFDPSRVWSFVAGGDVMLDRDVFERIRILGAGEDFPWDGGYARIARRECCNVIGEPLPVGRRTGGHGAVRALFRHADLAMVNLEGAVPRNWRHHPDGLVFTFDPSLLQGLVNAGVDCVSLGNNHVGNGGRRGIVQTVRNVERYGLAHAGAGRDLATAREPAWFEVAGERIAILAYDRVNPLYWAGDRLPGSAPLIRRLFVQDIRAARAAGATVVIVWPHWGVQYRSKPIPAQRRAAQAMIRAGADLVVGNHAHWAGGMEELDGKLVLYSLGDFIFDQLRSEETMESIVPELTFHGPRLVQVRLHPTILIDKSQPNLLDPAGDGRVVLDRVRKASRATLGW